MSENNKLNRITNFAIPHLGSTTLPNSHLRRRPQEDHPTKQNSGYSLADAISIIVIILLTGCGLSACSSKNINEEASVTAHAPVSVTHINRGAISDSVTLSATTYYLSDNQITAPAGGYITKAGIKPGDHVRKGQVLFEIKTREAQALESDSGNSSTLGRIQITAPTEGTLSSVLHVKDDYVQDGAKLAQLVDPDHFYLKLFVPREYSQVVISGQQVEIPLSDSRKIAAEVTGRLSSADQVTQTLVWLLKPNEPVSLPEGLQVVIPLPLHQSEQTQYLPKKAVLTDESLHDFWVMKVLHDSLAVKIPVRTGIQTSQRIEILEPNFSPSDAIITDGNYGLEDSSLVQIENPGLVD